jgi:WD40 repeat protein
MRHSLALICVLSLVGSVQAQAPPSYAKQIQPFFSRWCVECHNSQESEGGLVLESFKALMEGGAHGAAVIPGKPETSRLVRVLEGTLKPSMPPKKAKQPPKDQVALVRAWVLAGARNDSVPVAKITLPPIAPKGKIATPVAALAYVPALKALAASGRGEVLLIGAASGDLLHRLPTGRDRVTALAVSQKGGFLAAAASTAGEGHEVRVWRIGPGHNVSSSFSVTTRHDDVIQHLTFSPDGNLLASAGYNRLIKLWDLKAGKLLHVLKDHSDSVYSLSFSPDGTLLVSGGADRAVKVWDVATGSRLYTLGESTDWVYAVAWAPDGKHLAAAGVDRSIRVWDVDRTGGRIVWSVFAHEGPVTRLVYSRDGKTLYSLSEDRSAKAWDTASMVERKFYSRQAEAPLAIALSPDQKQLAIGRYDGVVVVLDEATGKVAGQPLPIRPKPPVLAPIALPEAVRGQSIEIKLHGKNLSAAGVVSTLPGSVATVTARTADNLILRLALPATAAPGSYALRAKNESGESAPQAFLVDRFPATREKEPNDSPMTGQMITFPVTVVGAIDKAGDLDWYRFESKAGQEFGVQVLTAGLNSKLDPVLRLVDPEGNTVSESLTGVLGHTCSRTGVYALGIRDREYRGGGMPYRLSIGDIPIVTSVFPLGLQRGTETEIHVEGVHLGKVHSIRMKVPPTAAVGSRLPVPITTSEGPPLGAPSVVVGEFPEVAVAATEAAVAVPGTANGLIGEPSATNAWRFSARKGERLLLEVNAQRIGSPLDSTIEILDATGRPLPRATLRCLAKTYVAFRDHESRATGIRMEAWSELAVNDHLLVGSELLRIRELPRNPDDDCQFFARQGQRLGYLGTTPTQQPQGMPMYKVSVHPPGTTFAPNGLPVVTVFWRNDDGGPGFGKDSRLVFDPPADGTYRVRVADGRGEGSKAHAYRLTIRPPRPDYSVRFSTPGQVSRGSAVPVRVNVERTDEFEGPIQAKLVNLPAGLSAPETFVPAGELSTSFALYADPAAKLPARRTPLELEARAIIDGKEVVRKTTATIPTLIAPGDIVTTTEQSEVSIRPGGEVRVTVKVERRNGFKGRIPLEVLGLPHGLRVLDVGLNGILVIPGETTRTIVIQADAWVQPMQHPFVVLARREGKGSEHAAKTVMLRVVRP